MAVAETIASRFRGDTSVKLPKQVETRINRGKDDLRRRAPKINEQFEFWRGNQYAYVDDKNVLQFLSTTASVRSSGKRPWRARTTRNLIVDIVAHEVSAATQRVPSYEIVPSTTDPEDVGAARLAQRIALFGYDKWGLRDATIKAVTHAVVGNESFAWPYFDTSIGPFIEGEGEGEDSVGQGEVRVRIYGANEVFWEPGCRFEDSPWHCIQQARPIEQVMQMDGYIGSELKPDAGDDSQAMRGRDRPADARMVTVTEYLERPSPRNGEGTWITLANKRAILKPRPYPDEDGLCLHKLSYILDPDSDRDMGLVRQLIDAQRTYNDCVNKLIEWKNLALLPQLFVTPGLLRRQRITDEPGAVYEVPQPDQNIKWRETPAVPRELFDMLNQAQGDMARIAAQNDIPSQVEAGKAIQALTEKDSSRRQSFVAQLSDWHSDVMRSCLRLVQRHYTEPRLVKLKGRFGWESIQDFKGADLRGQTDVRVSPGSIEPRTRTQMEQKVLAFADRGWITPEQAMAAIDGGYAEDLARSYELDVARAHRIIERIKMGPEALFSQGPQAKVDPTTGQPQEIPSWMPRQFDNTQVHKSVFEDWMKTEDYEMLDGGMKAAADEYYQGLLHIEAQKAQQAAEQQALMAESQGMDNAARPQSNGKPAPDKPMPEGNQLPTPNQPTSQSRPTELQ